MTPPMRPRPSREEHSSRILSKLSEIKLGADIMSHGLSIRSFVLAALASGSLTSAAVADARLDPDRLSEIAPVALRPLAPEPHPYTIGRGRFAYEVDVVNFTLDRHDPDRSNQRVTAWEWPLRVSYGLTDDLDVQVGVDTFVTETVRDRRAGTRERSSGFGDITLRLKWNVLGNDGADDEAFALALAPQIRVPTRRHGLTPNGVEGGLEVPMKAYLPEGFELEWTPGFFIARNAADDGVTFEWTSLLNIGREVFDGWTLFGEFETSLTSEEPEEWVGAINLGVTWDVTDDFVLEFASAIGVTRSADDLNLALTVVQRF
ncbi:MAG: transporter [Phycisphaerales bacterium]|nr:MAG: transporter [Phycisphaerales bacterium]